MTEYELDLYMLDMAITPFLDAAGGAIARDILYGCAVLPPHYDEVFTRLVQEGYLEENRYGFKITHKGRAVMHEGGFLGNYRRKRKGAVLKVIGIITGVAGVLLALLAS